MSLKPNVNVNKTEDSGPPTPHGPSLYVSSVASAPTVPVPMGGMSPLALGGVGGMGASMGVEGMFVQILAAVERSVSSLAPLSSFSRSSSGFASVGLGPLALTCIC